MTCMAWIHGMHMETKPTAIKKKNKHVNDKQKWMIILKREKKVVLMKSEHKT